MARTVSRLTPQQVKGLTNPGRYADGGSLYLSISPNGGKRWTFVYRRRIPDPKPDGPRFKTTEIGLGAADGAHKVDLKDARTRAAEHRKELAEKKDPLAEKKKRLTACRRVPTFGELADQYIATKCSEWRSASHLEQWKLGLEKQVPSLRPMPVDQITMADVLKALKPIWAKTQVSASRLRNRIELVLDAAKAAGYCKGDNAARWRGNLDSFLPRRKTTDVKSHASMAYEDVLS